MTVFLICQHFFAVNQKFCLRNSTMFSNCIECDALTSTTSPLLIVLRISGFASSIVSNALPSAPFASSLASSPTVMTVPMPFDFA